MINILSTMMMSMNDERNNYNDEMKKNFLKTYKKTYIPCKDNK